MVCIQPLLPRFESSEGEAMYATTRTSSARNSEGAVGASFPHAPTASASVTAISANADDRIPIDSSTSPDCPPV